MDRLDEQRREALERLRDLFITKQILLEREKNRLKRIYGKECPEVRKIAEMLLRKVELLTDFDAYLDYSPIY